jgi:hypothetical protein
MTAEASWRRLRRMTRLCWILWLTSPFIFIGLGAPLSMLAGSDVPAGIVAVSLMAAWWFVCHQVGRFSCPRCGKPFFHTWWYHNGFARRCVHCGLPKWADPEASTQS